MKLWATQINAIDPRNGEMKIWGGPNVPGITQVFAELYCQENGLGYCEIIGELIMDIPCIPGTTLPDWGKATDYENEQLN